MTDWAWSLFGGVLIGVSASLAWSRARTITGVSGILGGFLRAPSVRGFRPGFLGGLLATSVLLHLALGARLASTLPARPIALIVVAGLLAGFGTQLGRGCTSGHGVCGVSRLSPRSLIATATFMVCAALVVVVTHHAWTGVAP